jgi:hypothetical protein
MFKYLANGLLGLGILVIALVIATAVGKLLDSRGVFVLLTGLVLCGELGLRWGIHYHRQRRYREPMWFLSPSIGGHYGLIPTWIWGVLVMVLGVGMLVVEIQDKRQLRAQEEAWEQRKQQTARQDEPNPPKKTAFDVEPRKIDGKCYVVLTSQHSAVLHDVHLISYYKIAAIQQRVQNNASPIQSWQPAEQLKWWTANEPEAFEAIDIEGYGQDPANQRVEVKMAWRPRGKGAP